MTGEIYFTWKPLVCEGCQVAGSKDNYLLYGTFDGDPQKRKSIMCQKCQAGVDQYIRRRGYQYLGWWLDLFGDQISCYDCEKSSVPLFSLDEYGEYFCPACQKGEEDRIRAEEQKS